jgi:hypothetical protein
VYAAPPRPDLEPFALCRKAVLQRGAAAVLRVPSATLSHGVAAAAHGLPWLRPPELPCVTVPRDHTVITGTHLHRRGIPTQHRQVVGTIAVTGPARTCLDVTREMGLLSGLITTDAALYRGLVTERDLEEAYSGLRGRAGLADGRAVIERSTGLSESPLETLSRFNMRDVLDAPELQVSLVTDGGRFLGRADFYWRRLGVVGEADGREKYSGDELYREKRRQDAMTDAGLVMTRWGWATARDPEKLSHQINRALYRARRLRAAGYPARALGVSNPRFVGSTARIRDAQSGRGAAG